MSDFNRRDRTPMKAVLQINLKTSSPAAAQQSLLEICERMRYEGLIDTCRFEIETPSGSVTEKCVLAEEKVIA